MLRATPRRSLNCSNRCTPRNASWTMSNVQRSPINSSVRATEQFIAPMFRHRIADVHTALPPPQGNLFFTIRSRLVWTHFLPHLDAHGTRHTKGAADLGDRPPCDAVLPPPCKVTGSARIGIVLGTDLLTEVEAREGKPHAERSDQIIRLDRALANRDRASDC